MRAEKKGRDWFVPLAEVERYRTERLGKRGRPPKANIPRAEMHLHHVHLFSENRADTADNLALLARENRNATNLP